MKSCEWDDIPCMKKPLIVASYTMRYNNETKIVYLCPKHGSELYKNNKYTNIMQREMIG